MKIICIHILTGELFMAVSRDVISMFYEEPIFGITEFIGTDSDPSRQCTELKQVYFKYHTILISENYRIE
jgi:hypothetical protein